MPAKFWRKRQIMSKSDGVHEEGDVCALCGGLVFDPVIPQKRHKWVNATAWRGLTDEEIWASDEIMEANSGYGANFETLRKLTKAIEAKLKELNT